MAQKDNHYLTGKLLLATPSIGDPRFHRAVIFICAHDEQGAMGLVINHEMPGVVFSDLAKQLKIQSDITFDNIDLTVLAGGPVESGRGFLLHSTDFEREETMDVGEKFGVTATVEALADVVKGEGPKDLLFILGYAGWDAGQLDLEMQDNAWLVVEPDEDLIFDSALGDKWNRAIDKLGIDPAMLSTVAGRA